MGATRIIVIITVISLFGIAIGIFICGIVSIVVELKDTEPEKPVSIRNMREAIETAEHLVYTEPFISVHEAAAVKKLIEYSKYKLDREDDLK